MEPNTVLVGDVDRVERRIPESHGKAECHLHCLDPSGKDLVIVLPENQAIKLYSVLNVYVKSAKYRP